MRAQIRFVRLAAPLMAGVLLSCAVPAAAPTVRLRLPPVPAAWAAALGEPSWSVRWTGSDGAPYRQDDAGPGLEIELSGSAASAILAYPYWPALGLEPAAARPAGAIYPFDEDDGWLVLDWAGGPPAVFFRELARAAGKPETRPELFDWPRFRALLAGPLVAAEVAADPWLVDWRLVAEKTRRTGFDRRRLVPRPTEPLAFTVPAAGPWAASSPFAPAPPWEAGSPATVAAAEEPDTVFCAEGALRYSRKAALWLPARGGPRLP